MQNQSTNYHLFTFFSSEFEIHVLYGEIKIEITSWDEGQKVFERIYKDGEKPIRETFTVFEEDKSMRYSNLRVSAFK